MSKPIVIEVNNVEGRVFNGTTKALNAIDKALSYFQEGFQWTPQFKRRAWDGRVHKFRKGTKKFPTGLLPRLTKALDKEGFVYKVMDMREPPRRSISEIADHLEYYKLNPRPYQLRGIEVGMKNHNMMFWWPTASGKTVLFGGLVLAYDLPTLILVNRTDLVEQHIKFLKRNTGMEIGGIYSGIYRPKHVTVATVQTLWAMRKKDRKLLKKFLSTIEYVLVDEAHHGEAKTFRKPVEDCVNASVRHGFSGTPYSLTSDDIELESVTGPVLSKVTMSYLIKRGYLSIPVITIHEFKDNIEVNSMHWNTVYRQGIVENSFRNKIGCVITEDRYNNDMQILITVRSKKHGFIINEMLTKRFGINNKEIVYLSGSDPQHVRDAVKKKFIDRDVRIIIVTSIWNEGIDVPNANALIKLDGGGGNTVRDNRGVRTTIQQVGRVLRKEKENENRDVNVSIKQYSFVDDIYDTCHNWLEKHSRNRVNTYNIEPEFKVGFTSW